MTATQCDLRSLGSLAAALLALCIPTTAQRDQPPQMQWQRTVADAVAIAHDRGLPLLLCVNLDKEPFSDRFAWEEYRRPAFGQLARGFVAVIVSPDRHNPSDHDPRGRRIPCPRFGTVTCGEHMAADADAYDSFFAGRRVAPRHIGIAPNGDRLFDRFLERNMQGVTDSLREHGGAPPAAGADRPLAALLGSRDAADRTAVERHFLELGKTQRVSILKQAAACDSEPFELLRLGLRDPATSVRRAARDTLAATATAGALELLLEVLDADLERTGRTALMASLERIAEDNPGAQRAFTVRRALTSVSPELVGPDWHDALAADPGGWPADVAQDEELSALDRQLDELGTRATQPDATATAKLALARATLRYALNRLHNQLDPTYLLEDVRAASMDAAADPSAQPRAAAALARVEYLLGDLPKAGAQARAALPSLRAEAGSAFVAEVLAILGKANAAELYGITDPDENYPAELIAEAHGAYAILLEHPFGTSEHAIAHLDLLGFLGSQRHLRTAAGAAVTRFPASAALHESFRGGLFGGDNPSEVEQAYEALRAAVADTATWDWFGGYASLVVAEEQQRQSNPEASFGAYGRAIEQLERSLAANEQFVDSASHFVALAHAGRARLDLDAKRLQQAVDEILACARTRPGSFGAKDGLQRTPASTARRVLDAVNQASREDLRVTLEEGLAASGISL